MRILPVAAVAVCGVMAAVAAWQVIESTDDLKDIGDYLPTSTPEQNVIEIAVDEGMSPQDIGERLEDAAVIDSATQFNVLVALLGYEGMLQAGDYEFQPGTPALTSVYRIRRGETSTRAVTVVEGWRQEEIADAVARQGISRDEFLAEAHVRNFDLALLQRVGKNETLEGYLFPATYPVRKDDTAISMLDKMLSAFDVSVGAEIRAAAESAGLSLHEVVTIASIIEQEAQVAEERPIMAQVFLSRLRQGIPLEADPTVQYAIATPASIRLFGYWKQELTRADLETDSPYNTYANEGLPPGPIGSPGLDAISAVVHPSTTNYLYFMAKGDGSHAFASTLDEHLDNVEKYRDQ